MDNRLDLQGLDNARQGRVSQDQLVRSHAGLIEPAEEFLAAEDVFELGEKRRTGEQLDLSGPPQSKDLPWKTGPEEV